MEGRSRSEETTVTHWHIHNLDKTQLLTMSRHLCLFVMQNSEVVLGRKWTIFKVPVSLSPHAMVSLSINFPFFVSRASTLKLGLQI
jgi:hypothetical protein